MTARNLLLLPGDGILAYQLTATLFAVPGKVLALAGLSTGPAPGQGRHDVLPAATPARLRN